MDSCRKSNVLSELHHDVRAPDFWSRAPVCSSTPIVMAKRWHVLAPRSWESLGLPVHHKLLSLLKEDFAAQKRIWLELKFIT